MAVGRFVRALSLSFSTSDESDGLPALESVPQLLSKITDNLDRILRFNRQWIDLVVTGCSVLASRVESGVVKWSSGPFSPDFVLGPTSMLMDDLLMSERFCRWRIDGVVIGCVVLALDVDWDGLWQLDERVLADLVISGALVSLP
jgi:hypothetical protein